MSNPNYAEVGKVMCELFNIVTINSKRDGKRYSFLAYQSMPAMSQGKRLFVDKQADSAMVAKLIESGLLHKDLTKSKVAAKSDLDE
jgi:hypothetical protein